MQRKLLSFTEFLLLLLLLLLLVVVVVVVLLLLLLLLFYFESNTFQKIRKFCASISGHLIRKSFHFPQIFDDSGEFAPSNIIIQRNAFLLNVCKRPYKSVWKTDRKTPLPEFILNNLNFAKKSFPLQSFPCNFSKTSKNIELLHCRRT